MYERLRTNPSTTNYLYNISRKHRVLYVETPKVACSTIKRGLQLAEGNGDVPSDVHKRADSPMASPKDDPALFQEAVFGSYFRFCFVRNPFGRILSCYLDKFVKSPWERERRLPAFGFPPEYSLSFKEFLTIIADQPNKDKDIHWMPQVDLLSIDVVSYDFIGRFDYFSYELKKLEKILGIPFNVTLSSHSTGADNVLQQYYGKKEKALLLDIYKEDFKTLLFSKDLRFV